MCSTNGGGARRLWPSTMSTRASTPATTGSPLRPQAGSSRSGTSRGRGCSRRSGGRKGAKAFIEQDEYRFISPVFSFNPKNGDVLELKGAALTNVPALDGLGAVAATEDFPPSDTPQPETAMNALNRLKQLLGLPEDAAEETLQAELDKLESLLTPANPAASDPPALPGQPPFPHQADPLPGNARPTLFDFLQACHPQAALTSLVRANTALRDQLSVALSVTQGDRVARSVETAVTDGRLSRGLVGWATALGRQNPEALETYLAAVSPIAALSSFQSTAAAPRCRLPPRLRSPMRSASSAPSSA